jgi:hypothetical protein
MDGVRRTRSKTNDTTISLVLGVVWCAALTGCPYPTVEHDHGLMVLAIQPSDSAAAVPLTVTPTFWFTRELGREMAFTVLLEGGGETIDMMTCQPNASGEVLQCPLEEPLRDDAQYELSIDLGDDGEIDGTSQFSTGMPRGLAFDVGQNLTVEQAGDSDFAADLFEEALVGGETTMLLALDLAPAPAALPWNGAFLIGQGQIKPRACDEGEVIVDGDYGFTLTAIGEVQADGGFRATTDFATLPVEIDGMPIYIIVREVVIRGTIDIADGFETIHKITIDALVPMSSMEELGEAFPGWAELVAELINAINPDVDIDGDGTNDACTLSISAEGVRVTLMEPKDD